MKVCIESQEDGTYSVYEEPADDAAGGVGAAEQMAAPAAGAPAAPPATPPIAPPAGPVAEGEEPGAQTTDNIDDALMMAKQLLEQSGEDDQGDDDNPANGSAPLPPDQAKAMWNQMAEKKMKAKAAMGAM